MSTTISRGGTARSAVPHRISPQNPTTNRRSASRQIASPLPVVSGEAHEALTTFLKQETDQKEQVRSCKPACYVKVNNVFRTKLLVQLQDKEQLVAKCITENNNLTSALSAAETRLNELYTEQSRWEMEIVQRMDIAEKLREQVREVEKEKRDLQRRYNEQVRAMPYYLSSHFNSPP